MANRIAPVALAFAVAALGACSSQSQAPLGGTASVGVNGSDAKFQVVKCSQLEWYRSIEIGGDSAGATVRLEQRGGPATADSVRIRNIGSFTGMYSQGDGSDAANVSLSGDRYTITGTAHGYQVNKPGEPADATFKISVTC